MNQTKQNKLNKLNEQLDTLSFQVEDALYQNKQGLLSRLTALQGQLLDERDRLIKSLNKK